jgi:cytochrome c553
MMLTRIILLGAVVIAAMLALAQFFARAGAASTTKARENAAEREIARRKIKRRIFKVAALLLMAIASGGFLFAASGIMSIKASSGHWPITAWFLNFAMRRSVVTHSLGVKPPALDDRALVMKGAGHYRIGCHPCHGGPGSSQPPRIPQWMTPHPPNLAREIPKWDAPELFYIVKHGVKFTGMPAWPAQQRDDEVWAVVAFLLLLPGLTADDYQRLVRDENLAADGAAPSVDPPGSREAPPIVRQSCAPCHGSDGSGRGVGAFPKLAGQKPEYFLASMKAYALGRRSSGIMEPVAAALSQEAMAELAHYYGTLPPDFNQKSQKPDATNHAVDAKFSLRSGQTAESLDAKSTAIARGREIALRGVPSQRVPACADCHGPSDFRRNPAYPMLAGQYADYLVLQLTLFQKQERGGTTYAHLMRPVAAGLKPQQMRDVALFYESLQD